MAVQRKAFFGLKSSSLTWGARQVATISKKGNTPRHRRQNRKSNHYATPPRGPVVQFTIMENSNLLHFARGSIIVIVVLPAITRLACGRFPTTPEKQETSRQLTPQSKLGECFEPMRRMHFQGAQFSRCSPSPHGIASSRNPVLHKSIMSCAPKKGYRPRGKRCGAGIRGAGA